LFFNVHRLLGHAKQLNFSETEMVGYILIALVSIAFIIMGIRGILEEFITPLRKTKQAKQWDQVNCTIISSELKELHSHGVWYYLKIIYSYEYKGQKYESDQYSFWIISMARKTIPQAIVEQYKESTFATCLVNPLNPSEAVLSLEQRLSMIRTLANISFIVIPMIALVCIIYRVIIQW
jgi:hypothetical protein